MGIYRPDMRWQALFDDLEAEAARERRADLAASAAELLRAERGAVTLAERLDAHRGRQVVVRLLGGGVVRGVLVDAGPHWVILDEGATQALVPAGAVVAVAHLGRRAGAGVAEVARRLDLRHVLRALARDRAFVRVFADGMELSGTIDRVGADHFDLATHDADRWRRSEEVTGVWSVPIGHLRCVRSGG